jgi:segregation and condensation protein B
MSGETAGWSLTQVIEAILFASQRPVSVRDLQEILKNAAEANKEDAFVAGFARTKEPVLRAAIHELEADCRGFSRSYEVRESAGGWQLVTKPEFSPWLRQLFPEYRSARLSAPALETLAIIAYRQPITRADMEAIRGVAVDGVVQTLLERGFIKIAGRAEVPGRPLLYETTQHFMHHFGLKNLNELPNADELRKIHLSAPPAQGDAQPLEPKPRDEESLKVAKEEPSISFETAQTQQKIP